MKKQRLHALTAGVLYVMFGLFAASTFALWAGDEPMKALESLREIPGAENLFAVVAGLMVASLVMAGLLFFRRTVSVAVLIASLIIAGVGVAWNVIAVLFWLSPIPFVWLAYRGRHDN